MLSYWKNGSYVALMVAQDQAELQQHTNVHCNNLDHFDICRYWIDRLTFVIALLAGHVMHALRTAVSCLIC